LAHGGTLLYPDCHFRSVSTDTRSLQAGDLFVALRGERFDAHRFLASAARQACGLVVERPDKNLVIPQWVVPDTTLALGQLAALARDQFTGTLVAITGSSGKTGVKNMVAAILRHSGPVLATRGNLNNHIGVPLTLFELAAEHRFAVIEMGASGPGEIAYLCRIARPSVAMINNVLPAHVEGFGSIAGVAAAKGEIYRGLSAAGVAVLNLDEPWGAEWRQNLPCVNTLTFSAAGRTADFTARDVVLDSEGRASFTLSTPQGEISVQLRVAGRHNLGNALAAAACAAAAGAGLGHIAAGLAAVTPAAGRMEFKHGRGGSRIIDDSYNANPGSVKAAIDSLAGFAGRRLLVLGDMAELGILAKSLHREIGRHAAEQKIDQLWAVGPLSACAVDTFGVQGRHFADKRSLTTALVSLLAEKDGAEAVTVLVKGSRSAGMEDIVNAITTTGGR
ncbi:MAG: UDP-N-acetylmuramoyl-tripeptide--D-alanyl-D-alanine ligase, partial [Porticoccaceae bacterium]